MYVFIGFLVAVLGPSLSAGCGNRPFQSRVVNGENASPHSWPWQISLRVNGRHICGGSLIDNDWVLTAAHCVYRNPRPSGYTVVVGAHRRTGSTSVQQTFRLKKLFEHEKFSMKHLKHDLALLQLEKPISASSQVNTVCLPSSGSRVPPGTQCYITGWGRTVGGGNAADTLQQAMLPVAAHSVCNSVNGQLLPVDERSMVCAGGQGKGGCQGDSGGPFVCQEGGKFVLRGAVSWGHQKCRTDHYTVFARVSNYIDWINQKKSGGGGSGGGICRDTMQQCPQYKPHCNYVSVKQLCPKTCGTCSGGGGGGGGGGGLCTDKNQHCSNWTHLCSNHPTVKALCKKTCKLC